MIMKIILEVLDALPWFLALGVGFAWFRLHESCEKWAVSGEFSVRCEDNNQAHSGQSRPAPSGTGFFREDGMEIAQEAENGEDWIDRLSDEELESELNKMESYYRNLGVID